jgi:hypothetical protein
MKNLLFALIFSTFAMEEIENLVPGFLNERDDVKFIMIQNKKCEEKITKQSVVKYLNKIKNEQHEVKECPICFDLIADDKEKLRSDCNHYYHFGCLKRWLQNQNSCPKCRNKIQDVRAWISLADLRNVKNRPPPHHLQNPENQNQPQNYFRQIQHVVTIYFDWIFKKSPAYIVGWLMWMSWGPRAYGHRWQGDDFHELLLNASTATNLTVPLIHNRLLKALVDVASLLMYLGSIIWLLMYFDDRQSFIVIIFLLLIATCIDVCFFDRTPLPNQN